MNSLFLKCEHESNHNGDDDHSYDINFFIIWHNSTHSSTNMDKKRQDTQKAIETHITYTHKQAHPHTLKQAHPHTQYR